jgi:hypothetical protein
MSFFPFQNSVQWSSPLPGLLIYWSRLSWHALNIDESSKTRSGAHTPYFLLLVLPQRKKEEKAKKGKVKKSKRFPIFSRRSSTGSHDVS